MLKNVRVTAFIVSELLREGIISTLTTQIRVTKCVYISYYSKIYTLEYIYATLTLITLGFLRVVFSSPPPLLLYISRRTKLIPIQLYRIVK